MTTSKTGKHGHAKCHFVAVDIFTGKKMEVPIKKLLLGAPPERIANPDAMANPDVLAWYVSYARTLAAQNSTPGEAAPALESWRS